MAKHNKLGSLDLSASAIAFPKNLDEFEDYEVPIHNNKGTFFAKLGS